MKASTHQHFGTCTHCIILLMSPANGIAPFHVSLPPPPSLSLSLSLSPPLSLILVSAAPYYRSVMMKMIPTLTLTLHLSFDGGTKPASSEWRNRRRRGPR